MYAMHVCIYVWVYHNACMDAMYGCVYGYHVMRVYVSCVRSTCIMRLDACVCVCVHCCFVGCRIQHMCLKQLFAMRYCMQCTSCSLCMHMCLCMSMRVATYVCTGCACDACKYVSMCLCM